MNSKVATSKTFSVCPDCHDILNADGCACQCSRHDNGRWYQRTGGWQYIPGAAELICSCASECKEDCRHKEPHVADDLKNDVDGEECQTYGCTQSDEYSGAKCDYIRKKDTVKGV